MLILVYYIFRKRIMQQTQSMAIATVVGTSAAVGTGTILP